MPDFQAWKRGGKAISGSPRAVDAWRRIQDKPTQIIIVRDLGGALAEQTVRVEWSGEVRDVMGQVGTVGERQITVFGVQGHPTVPDTDIRRGDQFALDGVQYKVVDVLVTLGEIQARVEARS